MEAVDCLGFCSSSWPVKPSTLWLACLAFRGFAATTSSSERSGDRRKRQMQLSVVLPTCLSSEHLKGKVASSTAPTKRHPCIEGQSACSLPGAQRHLPQTLTFHEARAEPANIASCHV